MNFINFLESFIDPSSGKTYNYSTRNEFLKKFSGKNDVFVTFHNVPKFGLNPINKYNTPTGIYSYPVDYVISRWNDESKTFSVPFAGNSYFFTVFRHIKNKLITIDIDLGITGEKLPGSSSDSQKKLNEFVISLIKYIFKKLDKEGYKNQSDVKHSLSSLSYLISLFECNYPNCPVKFINDANKIETNIINFIAHYAVIFPNLPSSLTDLEKTSKILSLVDINEKDKIHNIVNEYNPEADKKIKYPYEDLIKPLWSSEDEFYKDKNKLLLTNEFTIFGKIAKLACPASFIWVMLLIKAGENKIKFNKLCRSAGIAGFFDKGTGTIHHNEKFQAVFFDKSDLSVISPSPIDNTKYEIAQAKAGHYYTRQDKKRQSWLERFDDNILYYLNVLFSYDNILSDLEIYGQGRSATTLQFKKNQESSLKKIINYNNKLIGMLHRPDDISYNANNKLKVLIENLIIKLKVYSIKISYQSSNDLANNLAKDFSVLADLLENYLKMVSVSKDWGSV